MAKNLYDFVEKQRAVNSSDFTTTGSLINLNVGSFKSYTKVVSSDQMLYSSILQINIFVSVIILLVYGKQNIIIIILKINLNTF